MKIYSSTVTIDDVRNALTRGRERGIINPATYFAHLRPFAPRRGGRGFDVYLLCADYDGRGRRKPAGYSRGVAEGDYAATYDEWGHFIAALYELDEWAQIGTYQHRQHFNRVTGDSYDPRMFTLDYRLSGADPYPFVLGSVSNGRSGRVGAGRDDGDSRYLQRDYDAAVEWYEAGNLTKRQGLSVRYAPRTPEQVAAFCGVSIEAVTK
jgi:hypothetical protein